MHLFRDLIAVASAMLLACIMAGAASAQSIASDPPLEAVLQKELKPCPEPCVIELISGEPASQAFNDLLMTVGREGGIAALPDSSEQIACAFNPRGPRVIDYLDSIVTAEPRYRWTRTDDVLNLIPVLEPALLTTLISEFSAEDANVWELLAILKQNPDFVAASRKLSLVDRGSNQKEADGLYGFYVGGSGKVAQPTTLISIRLQQRTVRQILNEIVKRDGTWHYGEFSRPDGTRVFELTIGDYYSGPPRKK